MPHRGHITTHVLDVQRGRPAADLGVTLDIRIAGRWTDLARSSTNAEGRVEGLLPPDAHLEPGTYRLQFETGPWFAKTGTPGFYPFVTIVFEVTHSEEHYHVPLLLSAHGYTTYRGS